MRADTLGFLSRASRPAAFVGALAIAAAAGLVACSSTASPPGGSSSSSSKSSSSSSGTAASSSGESPTLSTSVEVGDTIVYALMSQTATLSCQEGKSLNVTGGDNTLTVNGSCETVRVVGKGNKITVDKITKKLSVLGLDNTITYKDGDPEVSNIGGSSNTITKGG